MNHGFEIVASADTRHDDSAGIPPPALQWLLEFEQANASRHPAKVWRDIHSRAKARGTSVVMGMNWPGCVHVPSPIMERAIQKKIVQVPERWHKLVPQADHARLLSMLAGWEVDRGIYRLTKTSISLAKNSVVNAPMTAKTFEAMPSRVLYMDLLDTVEFEGDSDARPWGFFASIDQPTPGDLELVLALDRGTHLDVQVIPLNGKTIDQIAFERLNAARRLATGAGGNVSASMREAARFGGPAIWAQDEVVDLAQTWHLCLSALLTTCINTERMDVLSDRPLDPLSSTRTSFVSWEVGRGIDRQIEMEMERYVTQDSDKNVVTSHAISGEWLQTKPNNVIGLRILPGYKFRMDDFIRRYAGNRPAGADIKRLEGPAK